MITTKVQNALNTFGDAVDAEQKAVNEQRAAVAASGDAQESLEKATAARDAAVKATADARQALDAALDEEQADAAQPSGS